MVEERTRPLHNIFDILSKLTPPPPEPELPKVEAPPADTPRDADAPAPDGQTPAEPSVKLDSSSHSSDDDIKLDIKEEPKKPKVDLQKYFLQTKDGNGVSIDQLRDSGKKIYGLYFGAKWSNPVRPRHSLKPNPTWSPGSQDFGFLSNTFSQSHFLF